MTRRERTIGFGVPYCPICNNGTRHFGHDCPHNEANEKRRAARFWKSLKAALARSPEGKETERG